MRVYERADLSKHFWVSAALTVLSDAERALTVGIAKEMKDSTPGGTLGDAMAIFFYASLFPEFVDVGHATIGQFAAVLLLTAIAVGIPKRAYAKPASSAVLF